MNNITIIGVGQVGLVTGVCLSDIGHQVICYDLDKEKMDQLNTGLSPFYEPGLDELLKKNVNNRRLFFTDSPEEALSDADIIYIAVGTPKQLNDDIDLTYINNAAAMIGEYTTKNNVIVVTKSTVPVGTNTNIKQVIQRNARKTRNITMVSNPEFLREGSAIRDVFCADRIVLGSDCSEAAAIIEEINKPFNVPIFKTDLHSAEMIKYSSNAFLAMKISFINELANLCEKVGADIEEVAVGMGLDSRIGSEFLKAGIGYGGSCFPKDTHAMLKMSEEAGEKPDILKAVMKVNSRQHYVLVEKAKNYFGSLKGKRASVLGLAFKPHTDDIRESPSIMIINELITNGVSVVAYDPKAMENTKKMIGEKIQYASSIEETLTDTDMVFINTDWDEIKTFSLDQYEKLMNRPVIFDGRNCYSLDKVSEYKIDYFSIGRQPYRNASNRTWAPYT
ncbi:MULTISPECIES: UDP-glucose/GDP-mannose dehydrogenase family protein [Bacillaceae]|uniref:UDP-glucose 6-dehydrogenase n=1 Tax=Domibacillus aminovorans TaxID=29332 RepID=A0A177KMX7_9BACI|nr:MULTISPECIES: UDP-glucose/GDP-mannose dehydrogenase family protein [Bacillaceae]OAH54778.1 UDP-glucose 6-dehydrogenase [Domibacillus aminovorans]